MKKFYPALSFIFISLFFNEARAAQIPEKEFKTTNSPVFIANGFINFSTAYRNQSSQFEGKILPDNFSGNRFDYSGFIGNDSQVFLKSGVKNKYGRHGAVAKLELNVNSDKNYENLNLDQVFLFSENDFGNFEIGNNFAVNQKMKVGPARFARGAGGINGKYLEHVNLPMLANGSGNSSAACNGGATDSTCSNIKLPRFILLPQSPIGHGGYAKSFYTFGSNNNYRSGESGYGDFNQNRFRALKDDSFDGFEDSTKLSYYSPRLNGLQLGISYAPNGNDGGITKRTVKDIDQIQLRNLVSIGANYSDYFDNLGLAISATAEKGSVKNSSSNSGIQREDLLAYDFGITLEYFGFSFGASYGLWGKSLQAKSGIYSCDYDSSATLASQNCTSATTKKFSDPSYGSLGIAYQFGPIAASITGIQSQFQKNKYQAISFDVDYKLRKNLMPYFEITKFSFESNQPSASDIGNQGGITSSQRQLKNNQGYVFLTGILFSF